MKILKQLFNIPTLIIGVCILAIGITFSSIFPSTYDVYIIGILVLFLFYVGYLFIPVLIKKDFEIKKTYKNKYVNKIIVYLSNKDNRRALVKQSIVVVLFFVLFVRYMIGHDYLEEVIAMNTDVLTSINLVISNLFNEWFIAATLLVCINEFCKSNISKTLVKYISTPIFLLSLFFIFQIITGICGDLSQNSGDSRIYLIAVELGLSLSLTASTWLEDHSLKLTKEEGLALGLGWFFFLVTSINAYTLQLYFGTIHGTLIVPIDLNWTHRIFIYATVLLPILYFILLYRYDYKHRRMFLTFIALNVLFAYLASTRGEIFTSVSNLQLHLCNTAMFIIPVTLIFKTTKLFYFTMFINVIGAILAILLPNYSTSIGFFNMEISKFYINHLYAAFMPILIVLLGIYERPKMKYFGYSMIGFVFYYILVLILNAIFGTNYFFLNSDFIPDKFGDWGVNIFNMSFEFTIGDITLTFHPLYQLLFFLGYNVLALLMWYIYELIFKIVDDLTLLVEKTKAYKQNKKEFINILEKERGKNMSKIKKELNTIDFDSLEATLEISHLKKIYGNSNNVAVKDFSLSLTGGKIYGFLGKNGAGKSTIIKSIVGMHTFNEGEIKVCGFDVKNQSVLAKECIGFVPDHYALYENLTGRQYINYIADLYDVKKKDRNERLDQFLPKLELVEQFDRQIKTYSHGMKQKITILGALIHNPKIWILDEPMTGVDPNSIFQIKECMREHAKKGNIVFFSSHLIDVVSNLCDEIIIIKKGDFVLRAGLNELHKNKVDLEKLFLEKTKDEEEKDIKNLNITRGKAA